MNTRLTIRSIFTAAVLGCSVAAHPLSLGPLTGSAVVGWPLEVSAPLQLDEAADGNGGNCVSAELTYGSQPVDGAKIRVDVSPDGQLARISSPVVVDEPFVTLVLHAGCGRQSTRRYLLLADAPLEAPVVLAALSSLSSPGSGGSPSTAVLGASRSSTAFAAATRVAAVRSQHRPAIARRVAMDKPRAVGRSSGRLQLALWEPGLEGSPWLRASTELLSTPTADAAHRAAATALWRALNAQPQDLLRTADRLRGLEGEVSALRGLAGRHRSELSLARESFQDSRRERYGNIALVMTLALLAGGGAALFWHRSRRAQYIASYASWYPPLEPQVETPVMERHAMEPVAMPVHQGVAAPAPAHQPAVQHCDVVLPWQPEPVTEIVPPALEQKLPAPVDDFVAPRLKVDALHGAQQQSEFFASLGQYDEAVAVLTDYLIESPDKPVLVYLELFRMYHGLERRGDFEELRSAFRHAFGIDGPLFAEYSHECRELELYPVAVSRISASWPSQASLQLIEGLLFNRPAAARELLSVDAYRELIWIYSLGQEIVHSTGSPAGLQLLGGADLPNDHFILPWAMGSGSEPPELSLDRLHDIDVASQLSGFGVDIDLTTAPVEGQQVRVGERQETDQARQVAPAPAKVVATDDADAFDAVMESQSRKNIR